MRFPIGLCTAVAALTAAPAFGAGLTVTNTVFAQQRSTAPDGTTRIALTPATRVTPGDRVVYQLAYRNGGAQPIEGLTLNNPLPDALAYRGPAQGSPAPEVSVDGKTYGPLATLKVRGADGAWHAARPEDVTHVRWRIANALPAGAAGKVAFEAVLK
ncbi:hypothetical protein KFK14_17955 [Sphingobium phenoxybenzoativorans]|uniref:DUF11 domain-containing protein n=1 Tax=Sphingobium phenoxybenzoativorans TaxID=1592790 RepID=A0A975K4W2_9SPHN|nr:hypothetical protein [Sphingobium phenoxybenzoativorans]QUT04890.1 hypothetical protein KFK14_17955 [Sphingobium phenoxybenzoativorans]